MKNKKMLLFAGVLAAFLMLAVPFAVVALNDDGTDASTDQSDIDWSAFEGENANVTITISKDTILSKTVNISPGVRTLIIEEGVKLTASENVVDMFTISGNGVTFNIQNRGQIIGIDDVEKKSTIVWVTRYATNTNISVEGGYYEDNRPFTIYQAIKAEIEGVDIKCSTAGVWTGNAGVDNLILRNVNINSDAIGLYLGCQKKATLDNIDVKSEFTALEIKSGEVAIKDSSFSGKTFNKNTEAVGSSSAGAAVAPIVINNYYCPDAGATNGVLVTIDEETSIGYSDDTANVPMVIVAAGQKTSDDKIYPINVTWKDARYIAGYATIAVDAYGKTIGEFEVNNSSIVVNGFTLVDDASKLSDALSQGNNVILIDNIEIKNLADSTNAFIISKPTIIDGQGHKISVSKTYDGRIFTIATPGKVVIKNIEMEISGTYSRGVNFAAGCNGTEVTLENVTLTAGYYALNIPNGIVGTTKIDVIDSVISGYAALNVWSDLDITFTDSKIFSENKYTVENEGNFSTIVINNALGDNGDGSTFRTDITFVRTELNAAASSTSTQNVINYRANTFGTVTFVDSRINGSGIGYAISIESEDVVVVVDESLIISDDSEMEILIEGTLELNGIINDNGKGSVTIGELTGNGYVTGSNVAAWASTGVQELDSNSKNVTDGTKEVDSDKNTVVIDTTNDVSVNELTVNLRDNGNNITVKFPAGTVVSDNALIHISESQSSMTESVFEVVINGIDNKDEDVFITIPRENNGLEPVVTWIDEDGRPIEDMRIHSDDGTSVTFITTHNSLYKLSYNSSGSSAPGFTPGMGTVTDEASEGFSTADYATMAGIVIAVVMLIGLVCIVRRS